MLLAKNALYFTRVLLVLLAVTAYTGNKCTLRHCYVLQDSLNQGEVYILECWWDSAFKMPRDSMFNLAVKMYIKSSLAPRVSV